MGLRGLNKKYVDKFVTLELVKIHKVKYAWFVSHQKLKIQYQ